MSSLAETIETARGVDIRIEAERFYVLLEDGREVGVPYRWYWRLEDATDRQRRQWSFIADRKGIEWEAVDEHISVAGIIKGNRGPKRPKAKRAVR